MNDKVFIIAEAGVNHNGSLETAKRMVDVACRCGVDAIKFQTFRTEGLVSKYAPKAGYQKKYSRDRESQFEMLSGLELSPESHEELLRYCRGRHIIFISSSFDLESIDLLKRFNLDILKIPSGEITNLPYLKKIASLGKRIILSTGMSIIPEIKTAMDTLIRYGTKKKDITILHCNSAYPTPAEDVNLRAMLTIRDKLKVKVGYSDHTLGIEVSIAAVALGATIIEKHFTLNKNMNGPDHKISLDPAELKRMVEAIRDIERALGNGIKKPSKSEKKNIPIVRKSIVALQEIRKGEVFTENNLTIKRPGTGINPMRWDEIIGNASKKYFKKDELITL